MSVYKNLQKKGTWSKPLVGVKGSKRERKSQRPKQGGDGYLPFQEGQGEADLWEVGNSKGQSNLTSDGKKNHGVRQPKKKRDNKGKKVLV